MFDPKKWAEMRITSGRWVFDDAGFNEVLVREESHPNPAVIANGRVRCYNVCKFGKKRKVTPCWEDGGIPGADERIFLREDVVEGLEEADKLLATLGLALMVVDGGRLYQTQASGFNQMFWRTRGGPTTADAQRMAFEGMPVEDLFRTGRKAKAGFSFFPIKKNNLWATERALMLVAQAKEVGYLATEFGMTPDAVVEEALNYMGNIQIALEPEYALEPDLDRQTAHGSLGAADVILIDLATGEPVYMGSPSDYTGRLSKLEYFERATFQQFIADLAKDEVSQKYAADFGITVPTEADFLLAQKHRRILYWAMIAVGATGYNEDDEAQENGEWWHYNLPRRHGPLAGYGNACHAVLMGQPFAVFGVRRAHEDVEKFLRKQ